MQFNTGNITFPKDNTASEINTSVCFSANKKRKPQDQLDTLLDKLTDPTVKQKKKEKKEKRQEEKRERIVESDKKYAKDMFNHDPTSEEVTLWKSNVNAIVLDLTTLQKLYDESVASLIEYKKLDRLDGLYCVLDFVNCAEYTKTWLEIQMTKLGWKTNMTLYHPIAVSNSTDELLSATLECYRMMIKQMMLLVKLQEKK